MEDYSVEKMERLRSEMINLYLEIGNLADPRVVEISQKLDVYLVEFQKQQKSVRRSAESDLS